jgi:hypothetical protein
VTSRKPTRQLSADQSMRYAELLRVSDADALHELLLRHGPAILDRELPYLVVAAGNQRRSMARRGAASHEIPTTDIGADEGAHSLWDPLASAIAREGFGELLTALGDLDPRDLLVLWSHAAGASDTEIAAQWDELQFNPPSPSIESIRKRRERARVQLRKRLGR